MIRTERLILRQWTEADVEPCAELSADPRVMEHFPRHLTFDESAALVDRAAQHLDKHGWGLWAVEVTETGEFAGFTGLWPTRFEARFTPAVEVGWRLAHAYWGHGYATEAARASLEVGFGPVGLSEIVSFTAALNRRSWRVMEKLGMTHDPDDDFDHPRVPEGHRLRRHVLYRLPAADHRPSGYSPTVS